MIKYNTLEIDGDYLKINIKVEDPDDDFNKKFILKGVKIDTPLTYGKDNPYIKDEGPAYTDTYIKELFIPEIKKELIIITPIINEETEMSCKEIAQTKRVIYDKSIIYNKGLSYLSEFGDTCTPPKGFMDFILKVKAFELAVDTCNFDLAIKYWNYIKGINSTSNSIKNCGCNG